MSLGELRGGAAHIAACIRAAMLAPGVVCSNGDLVLPRNGVSLINIQCCDDDISPWL